MTLEDSLKSLNPQQLEAVNYDEGPCLIVAGAGTGKTKTLTTKIAKLIADGYNPARILAVTFTNKAAQEMRERVEALVPGAAIYGNDPVVAVQILALAAVRQTEGMGAGDFETFDYVVHVSRLYCFRLQS